MTKFSRRKADEVPDRNSDNAQRRSRPADRGPWSPRQIDALYGQGRERPNLKADTKIQKPQFPEDRHDARLGRYSNDVPLRGDRAWLRGGGEGHRPNMDTGKYDISNQPDRRAAGGGRCTASGLDMKSSPFSAAHRTWKD